MADAVYGIRRDRMLYNDGAGPMELEVRCLKPRDFEPPAPFRIAASYQSDDGTIKSFIDESGDFNLVQAVEVIQAEEKAFLKAVTQDETLSRKELAGLLNWTEYKVRSVSKKLGYMRSDGRHGTWFLRTMNSTAASTAATI
jgi:hypothetical protein